MAAKEQCESTCPDTKGGPDFRCELKKDHKGKHDSILGGFWSDGGAERLRTEQARRAEIEKEPF